MADDIDSDSNSVPTPLNNDAITPDFILRELVPKAKEMESLFIMAFYKDGSFEPRQFGSVAHCALAGAVLTDIALEATRD